MKRIQTVEQDREGSIEMSKINSQLSFQAAGIDCFEAREANNRPSSEILPPAAYSPESLDNRRSVLAELISSYLRSNGLRQIDFCRQVGFNQGLLSKILSSVVNTLNVETALKLAEGMNLPPRVVFEAIGKSDVHEMLVRAYGRPVSDRAM